MAESHGSLSSVLSDTDTVTSLPAPFTVQDVEIIRLMRLRKTRQKYRTILLFELLMLFASAGSVAFYFLKYNVFEAQDRHFATFQFWVFISSIIMLVISGIATFLTLKRYGQLLAYYKNPSTHPNSILNGDSPSLFRLKKEGQGQNQQQYPRMSRAPSLMSVRSIGIKPYPISSPQRAHLSRALY
ncbi:hypothetical protein H4219_000252 [Mycoemilia scoparia]|uniref:Uncharacterized protein n=1 Tax=Mycoemilia scoparia TaxID=417184 RepID=A0A9W8A770_9FUNG|nr:hypothetical protein H4219_000252 [Mycoemilia scoparia]